MRGRTLLLVLLALCSSPVLSATAPIDAAIRQATAAETQEKFQEVIDILRPYAESNNADVEFRLANAYFVLAINGQKEASIASKDIAPAMDFAKRAAEHGNGGGMNLLYLIHANGYGVPADEVKAADYLRRGAELGDRGARINYAVSLYLGTPAIEKDTKRACALFSDMTAANEPDVIATYYMGVITFRGQCGIEVDKIKGVEMIRAAADAGVREAEKDMGKSLEFGWVTPPDIKGALRWYERAAAHGESTAEWRVGMAYVNGEFRDKDSKKAVQYFKSSAASDDPDGLTSLAVMYATGDGVDRDSKKAFDLYQKAADLGQPHAYRGLAVMYANAEGVPADPVRAYLSYLQAIELGEPDDARMRQVIESKLDATQRQESKRQFEQWKAARNQ